MTFVKRASAVCAGILACLGQAAAQELPPIETTFADGSTVRVTGQINQGVLSYDDGEDTNSFGLVDNDNASTRIGLRYGREIAEGWRFGTRIEIGYAPFSTSNVSQLNDSEGDWGFDNDNIRWIDFSLASPGAGTVSLGQGAMATDGITEVDLSGTDVIGYSGVADSASGQFLVLEDPADPEAPFGPTVGDAFANFDGPRRLRIRYDTPEYAGFGVSAAFGQNRLSRNPDVREDDLADISLNYGGEFAEVEVAASAGYFYNAERDDVLGGSASVLHGPTGLNATVAAARAYRETGDDATFGYAKLGLLRDFSGFGDTAVAIDYYMGNEINLPEDGGSESESWGVMLVQTVERANVDLWLTYRTYAYDEDAAAYEDGRAIFGGARFRF